MLFNTFEYVVFLAVCVGVYYFLNLRGRLFLLLAASYLFYGVWSFKYSLLMAWISVWDNSVALLLSSSSDPRRRRLILTVGVLGSLAVLVYFKYTNFLLDTVTWGSTLLGHPLATHHLDIVLPLGVSFHTFQGMSYFIDVYRGNIEARKDVLPYFVYNSFFPQLVAGPIERASHILPQLDRLLPFFWVNIYRGISQILWGLVKKVVFADNLAYYVDTIFNTALERSPLELLFGLYAFAFQIYFDFSGYSDIAIGSGRCFGIRLSRNFNLPYFAVDFRDFWRRWHITLSNWLRDYVYLSLVLGLPRKGKVSSLRIYGSLLATMWIAGIWHGANVTFMLWGLFHGSLLCANHWLDQRFRAYKRALTWPPFRLASTVLTFHAVCASYVFFRCRTVAEALIYFRGLGGGWATGAPLLHHDIWGVVGWLLIIVLGQILWYLLDRKILFILAWRGPLAYGTYLATAVLTLLIFRSGLAGTFIYFEF